MRVVARTRQLGRVLDTFSEASRELGFALAKRLFTRLNQIRSSASEADLRGDRTLDFHALVGDRQGMFAIKLGNRERLICTLQQDEAGMILIVEEISRDHYQD